MKKTILIICIAISSSMTLKAQTTSRHDSTISISVDSVSFKVSGNCGMCKRTIEKAAMISGVSNADWDMESDTIKVVYDPLKTKVLDIHKAIAASGYDTEKVKAKTSTYNGLPGCCQYERTK